jgi:hypothetical protein
MSAISWEHVKELIRENKTVCLKIDDLSRRHICEIINEAYTVEDTINALEAKKSMLSSYGRINITAANWNGHKGDWKKKFEWYVITDGINTPALIGNEVGTTQRGYISASEAALMAKYEALVIQSQFQKQIDEMNYKLSGAKGESMAEMIKSAMPFLPLFINDPNKLAAVANMAGMMQQAQGMAGKSPSFEVHQTEDETQKQLNIISEHLNILIKEVGIDKVQRLVIGIAKKPNLVDTALTFL